MQRNLHFSVDEVQNCDRMFLFQIRTKPGDVESIQKMLANLPEKRTRRAINFDEISTRSQATIHSVSLRLYEYFCIPRFKLLVVP